MKAIIKYFGSLIHCIWVGLDRLGVFGILGVFGLGVLVIIFFILIGVLVIIMLEGNVYTVGFT